MRRTRRAAPRGAGPGLQRLADVVSEALSDLLDVPRPAMAGGPHGPSIMHSAARHAGTAGVRPGSSITGSMHVGPRRRTVAEESDPSRTWGLVERAQEGDGEAFGQLYDEYVDAVYRFVYYRVHDQALAEDLTSETFLRALRRIRSVEYQGRDIGAWFMTIARNLVFDHAKAARTRLEVVTGEVVEPDDDASTAPSPESLVLAGLTAEQLVRAVNQLGEEQRECIVLRFVQGLSVNETAEVMGKRDGAIKAMQHRAVKRLAVILADAGITPDRAVPADEPADIPADNPGGAS